jgi:hypothetical protein
MTTRAGNALLYELFAIGAILVIVIALVAAVTGERRQATAIDRRMAELDTAQDLLAHLRHGDHLTAPAGWACELVKLPGGVAQATVIAPDGLRLSTVCGVQP